MKIPRQCAILVGGLGTRLGQLTTDTPKPLLDCGGRPFLAWILRELSRFGIDEVVLLAGYKSDRIEKFRREVSALLPKPMTVKISVEPVPSGTGGAVWHARDLLDDTFLLINGDSWIDTNLARFFAAAAVPSDALGHVLLRTMENCSRYGIVERRGQHVVAFHERSPANASGVINGGVYILDKGAFAFMTSNCSLETDILPTLAVKGMLRGEVTNDYFIDIGIPSDYARAQQELPQRFRRSAVFFDRDGVLNEDRGWVGMRERFIWIDGAKDAVQLVNDGGSHAFLVTNQAGVARGLYEESDVRDLHRFISDEMLAHGGTLDDIRFCPFHPDAAVDAYRRDSDWRKPAPGMITDLVGKWDVDLSGSFFVGDKESDLQAARAACIPGYMFTGGNVCDFIGRHLPQTTKDIVDGSPVESQRQVS